MTSGENPYAASSSDPIQPSPLTVRRQLLPVAVALLVASILHIFGGLFYFVFVYSVIAAPDANPQGQHAMLVFSMYFGISMLYCLLLISGAFSMMRQGSHLWAVTTCILALIPFLGPCYFLAVPFGIWGLMLLRRPEIRNSFARA